MTWHQIPFLRILFPFMAGVVLESYTQWGNVLLFWWYFGIGSMVLFLTIFFLKARPNWKQIHLWGAALQYSLFIIGILLTARSNESYENQHFTQLIAANNQSRHLNYFLVRIEEPPQIKSTTVRAFAKILALQNDTLALSNSHTWQNAIGNLLLTLPLDTQSMALNYGDILVLHTQPKAILGAMNPYALDLTTYYSIKKVYHQAYVPALHWQKIAAEQGTWFWQSIYDLRAYLVKIFKRYCPTDREYAVLAGLVLGVREDMDKEIIQAYADVGAMHILSVSGLHVGLIAWILLFLFDRIKIKHYTWRLSKTILVVGLIWLFALLTGATPPALRSAAMFSFVSIAKLNGRNSSIYNSLAASAFFLLLYNPLWFWDAGFQLSYLALLGIVYYQDRIYRLYYIENKFLAWVWNMTTVSIGASITTFALGLFYFHQFSFSSFLSGLVAIPLSSILLPLGFLLLILGEVPIVSDILGFANYWLVWLLNASVFIFQALPYSVLKEVWIDRVALFLLHFMVIIFTYAFYKKRLRWALIGQGALACLAFILSQESISKMQQREFCIYSVHKGTALSIIEGDKALTFADSATLQSNGLNFAQSNYLQALSIKQHDKLPLYTDLDFMQEAVYVSKTDIIQLPDFSCAIYSPFSKKYKNKKEPYSVDAVLVTNNISAKQNAKYLLEQYNFKQLIVDASNSFYQIQQWEKWADSLQIPFYNIVEKGAYRKQWQ